MKKHLISLKTKTLLALSLVLAAIVVIISCQKTSNSSKPLPPADAKLQKLNATNNIIASTTIDEENLDMIMDRGEYADNSTEKAAACRIVTFDPSRNVFPHTKTIDYGGGCIVNGKTRKGKLIITYYDPEAEAGGLFTLTTYENYYVDEILVEGSVKVNKIKNGSGQTVLINLINKTYTSPTGDVREYAGTSFWTLIAWDGIEENAYEITSSTVGKETMNGVEASNFQSDIDDANHAILPLSCNRRVQGGLISNIHIAGEGDLEEYLDYGNGVCDSEGTLSINGGTPETVTLPLKFWPLNL